MNGRSGCPVSLQVPWSKYGGKDGSTYRTDRQFTQNTVIHGCCGTRSTSHNNQHDNNQLKVLMFTVYSYLLLFFTLLFEKLPRFIYIFIFEFELLIDFWANSVSLVQTFQWLWMDSYLCILVTRAGFHRGITPLIGCLGCVQVKGPSWRKSKWLCPKSSVSVSLCLLSCWYKEPCVDRWCDVWICWCSDRQLFLHMYVCMYLGRRGRGLHGEYEVWDWTFVRKEVNWDFFGVSSQLQGPSFPRSITVFAARCQWLYYHETRLTWIHFTCCFQCRNSLEQPCVCFWCYVYKGN